MISTSECQRRLAGEYRVCLESIIPRLNSIIEGAYDDTPWRESRQESAKEAKTVIIELLDYVDRIVNVSESEFKRLYTKVVLREFFDFWCNLLYGVILHFCIHLRKIG